MGITNNLDDKSLPNHLVAYGVKTTQMRKSKTTGWGFKVTQHVSVKLKILPS